MFNGSLNGLHDKGGPEAVTSALRAYFDNVLGAFRFDEVNMFSAFEGIQFLPVDKNVYLRIQSFINLLEFSFPLIRYSSFLYKDHLVWSGLEQVRSALNTKDDMRILYKYICEYLSNPDAANRVEKEGPYSLSHR